jgi:hypothetical protein
MASMMPEAKVVEIDGKRFKLYLLDATRGHPLYVKLVKVLGPSLLAMAVGESAGGDAAIAGALSNLLRSLDPELVTELCGVFGGFSEVEIEGKWPRVKNVFDQYFAGKYMHMTKWLVECCRHNFADFFDAGSLMSVLGSQASTSA